MSFQMTEELEDQFRALAYDRTEPFCYSCYRIVGNEHDKVYAVAAQSIEGNSYSLETWDAETHGYFCHKCGSDDLMRHLEGVGVEWSIEWVIESLIESECGLVDEEAAYDELLDELYPPYEIGYSKFFASDILKENDPICYRIGKQEHFDDQVHEGILIECNGSYYTPDCVAA